MFPCNLHKPQKTKTDISGQRSIDIHRLGRHLIRQTVSENVNGVLSAKP